MGIKEKAVSLLAAGALVLTLGTTAVAAGGSGNGLCAGTGSSQCTTAVCTQGDGTPVSGEGECTPVADGSGNQERVGQQKAECDNNGSGHHGGGSGQHCSR